MHTDIGRAFIPLAVDHDVRSVYAESRDRRALFDRQVHGRESHPRADVIPASDRTLDRVAVSEQTVCLSDLTAFDQFAYQRGRYLLAVDRHGLFNRDPDPSFFTQPLQSRGIPLPLCSEVKVESAVYPLCIQLFAQDLLHKLRGLHILHTVKIRKDQIIRTEFFDQLRLARIITQQIGRGLSQRLRGAFQKGQYNASVFSFILHTSLYHRAVTHVHAVKESQRHARALF